MRLLSSKSELHAALAEVSTRLSAAQLAESSMRHRLAEAEVQLIAAEAREAELWAASDAPSWAASDAPSWAASDAPEHGAVERRPERGPGAADGGISSGHVLPNKAGHDQSVVMGVGEAKASAHHDAHAGRTGRAGGRGARRASGGADAISSSGGGGGGGGGSGAHHGARGVGLSVVTGSSANVQQRLTESLLLKQRDEITSLKKRLAAVAVAEQVSGARAEQETEVATLSRHRAHSLQQQLSSSLAEADALRTECLGLRERLAALDARERARAEAIQIAGAEGGRLEAALHDAREVAARERLQTEAAHLAELGEARLAARKAAGALDELMAERAAGRLREARADGAVRALQRELSSAAAASAAREATITDEARRARAAAEAAIFEAASVSAALQERTVQVAILTETLEATRSGDGSDSDGQRHLISLGAQVIAPRWPLDGLLMAP